MKITLGLLVGYRTTQPWHDGKVAYKSEGAALAHIRALKRLHERKDFHGRVTPDLVPYRCRTCSLWHVGHLKEKPCVP